MTKVITVILQLEQDSAFTVARAPFARSFTDVIRVINGNPKLGRLRYAGYALADTMGSISRMDHEAHGAPMADVTRVFQQCKTCTNIVACQNRGGCILAQRAVDEAAAKLSLVSRTKSGTVMLEQDFLPGGRDDFAPIPKKKTTLRNRFEVEPRSSAGKKHTANRAVKNKAKKR